MFRYFNCLKCSAKVGTYRNVQKYCSRDCKDYVNHKTPKSKEYARIHQRSKYEGSRTSLGYLGELEAISIKKGARKLYRRGEPDLIWKNKKIEVKTANYIKTGWKFWCKRQVGLADYFMLICKKDGLTKHIFFMPGNTVDKNTIYIGNETITNFLKYSMKGGEF